VQLKAIGARLRQWTVRINDAAVDVKKQTPELFQSAFL
jgi:hypothetical protein